MSSHDQKYKKYAEKVKLFNGLSPDDVGVILKHGETLDFYEGQTIFHEGQLGSNIFVVLKGVVGIYVHQDMIAKCHVGDAFGEMSALNHKPHIGTACALTPVKCFVIKETQLNQILEARVAVRFLLNIIHILSSHLETSNKWNAELRRKIRQDQPA